MNETTMVGLTCWQSQERVPLDACTQMPRPLQFSGHSNLLMVMVYLQSEWSSPSTPANQVPVRTNHHHRSRVCSWWGLKVRMGGALAWLRPQVGRVCADANLAMVKHIIPGSSQSCCKQSMVHAVLAQGARHSCCCTHDSKKIRF